MLLGKQTWPGAKKQTGNVVVVPLGALEQHAHHLPLLTDWLIGAVLMRLVRRPNRYSPARLRHSMAIRPLLPQVPS